MVWKVIFMSNTSTVEIKVRVDCHLVGVLTTTIRLLF